MATVVLYKKKHPNRENLEALLAENIKKQYERRDFAAAPIPERQQNCQKFIRTAIDISQQHGLDIILMHHNYNIEAVLSFDCGEKMKYLKDLFLLADNFSFFTDIYDRDITISLEYYTHEIRINGEIIAP